MSKSLSSKSQMPYNNEFIKILGEMEVIMTRRGEPFRARAYHKASETIMSCDFDITSTSQLVGKQNIGETIMTKLNEYVSTGTLNIIEKHRNDPLTILTKVFGIGPKKAKDLIQEGIDTIDKLRLHKDDLTSAQKIGLEFFNDIEKPIPRQEIDAFKVRFSDIFFKNTPVGSEFEIVGSYRRGKSESGDIDIIVTNKTNDKTMFGSLIDALVKYKLITHILSKGQTKSLTLAKLDGNPHRRIDLMYSPPTEYAFATLYFTGSKSFNTVQRQRALDNGFTLNEHCLCKMVDGKKGVKVVEDFFTEQDIFKFLRMQYKEPNERIDCRSVVTEEKITIKRIKKNNNDIVSMSNFQKFKMGDKSALSSFTEKEIMYIIRKSDQAYHENNSPIITDAQYDYIVEYANEKYPHKKINSGHTTINMEPTKSKIKLPYEMWSLDKIKPDTDAIIKWKSKYSGPYVITCKLDGVSCLYVSPDKLYTRGNGKIGQDISHLIPHLRLPKDKGIVIRGELIMKKETFEEKYKMDFANPRNFVAGIVNQKTPHKERLRDISLVAYEVISPVLKPSDQMSMLKKMAIEAVYYTILDTITNDILSANLTTMRESYKYEIDGIVCCNDELYSRKCGNPEHAFAFKMVMTDQMVEAIVNDVIWSASKDGYIKPRVQIEPVLLGGVMIEYATGFNAKFIIDNKIGPGAIVSLVRSGDVIPHILNVVSQAKKPSMPSEKYVWNDTCVDIVLVDKSTDSDVNIKVTTLFFKTIGVDGLGPGNVKKIIAAGYNTIPSIISMTPEQFLEIDGFKQKMSSKIYDGIKDKLRDASLPLLMDATNIFGRGFGEKKFQTILLEIPDIILSDVSNEKKILQVSAVNGLAIKTAERFVEKIPEFIKWIKCVGIESKLQGQAVMTPTVSSGHVLYGKKIAITGFRDKKLVSAFELVGGISVDTISKNVFVVIVKNLDEDTGKACMAKTLGIPLMTHETFLHKFGITQ